MSLVRSVQYHFINAGLRIQAADACSVTDSTDFVSVTEGSYARVPKAPLSARFRAPYILIYN